MKTKNFSKSFIPVVLASSFLIACAGPKAPNGAEQVRNKLTQLQSDSKLASRAPVAIKAADAAVRLAEEPRDDKALGEHFVYLADRKVDTAYALAQARLLEDERKEMGEKTAQAQLDARTRETQSLKREIAELNAKQTERGLVVTLGDVLFETGKSDLKEGASVNLVKLVGFLNQQPEKSLVIEGHTDSVGSESYNQVLSQNRADSVKAYLISQGVASNRITAVGKGESAPVASNDSSSGKQMNRRVEIIIGN